MLDLIISGGQTGADIAGLKAAKDNGIPTSGWLPKGCKTLVGPKYDYLTLFNMKEHSSANYKERTWDNVLWADATVRIAHDFNSAGEKCTLNAIKAHNKPYFDIDVRLLDQHIEEFFVVENLIKFLVDNKVSTLNVAGNSHKTCIYMYDISYRFLDYVFRLMQKNGLCVKSG